jgi:hypothetical protein
MLSFNQGERLTFACDFFGWQWWNQKSWEVTDQSLSELVKEVESALALDVSV